ncbi:plasmid pRiA4b ORF-3 family protein [plant metagenome]|uniref:Plasmid pRiA4b ORF-3 family protein n=2 Tax=root TaxID=1 RepID=A0A1C3K5D5_9BURK|nr:plasmid pRiA4b ORF-3 family protein [Orrella dioscoreae]SBT26654.1 plasmid pRiA4b ORF-3 family protein [Orrella dioscoreae]SOE51220.1 plasmid pRiA4b ORF-3 family protein [Orrella dioscoreae]
MASDITREHSCEAGNVSHAKAASCRGAALVLRIELRQIQPVIYRTIVVPSRITLRKLHVTILLAMGWQGGHLHEFVINGVRYGEPDPDYPQAGLQSEKRVSLNKVIQGASSFDYVYDLGDHWEHEIQVLDATEFNEPLGGPWCLEGANACPPEDVGGEPGYMHFLQAISDPNHPEHDDMLLWHGKRFDLTAFDLQEVNQRMMQIWE